MIEIVSYAALFFTKAFLNIAKNNLFTSACLWLLNRTKEQAVYIMGYTINYTTIFKIIDFFNLYEKVLSL